ncbi:MAG: type II toxin-antitoxin system HicB family antitoxin [Firmicutes bacterium]|nr:type II toxin-antitoxin system HicB family antitoxin [Bacillota bacterium]
MKEIEYPIVFILNPETHQFNGYIPDLAIACEGETIEETLQAAEELVARFFELSKKYEIEVPEPSAIEHIKSKWNGYQVASVKVKI